MIGRSAVAALLSLEMVAAAGAADMDAVRQRAAPERTEQKEAPFFVFADTQISYRHAFTASEPGIPKLKTADPSDGRDIPKNILNIAHANAWAYGTNFLSLDVLKSGSQDPAGTRNEIPGQTTLFGYGATEAYGLYRGTLSGNKMTGTKAFAISGLIKDVSLSFGFDANAKNTPFGPRKRLVVGGLVFSIDVPVGFLNVAVHASKEWNRNGFAVAPYRDVTFETTPEFEIVYNFPLDGLLGGFPLRVAGFNNIVMPKGRTSTPTSTPTTVEFLSRTNLVLDVGKLIWNQPGRLDAFVGFQYWRNKFGNDMDYFSRAVTPAIYTTGISGAGAEEKTFLAGVSIHVF
ncbi:hypothetical protein [Methylobacterium gregans]|uniref:Uncharacterized protein n=1 Tax=Methylobacterium gregans TaxID=374424 RepID=A0AA37MBZ2_9HYPH|nr:hypothetical protein [Methylobacterium gregans]MDQ0522886.1 hypothetical protein [Methylobacterium gregans]GJD80580.1 hypothetical protein NBEOAGPD_3821 [Methylobacterium gregans]GLS55781.1 hypothetical protein GCM10007886_39660 [Methylobacterium gregans]